MRIERNSAEPLISKALFSSWVCHNVSEEHQKVKMLSSTGMQQRKEWNAMCKKISQVMKTAQKEHKVGKIGTAFVHDQDNEEFQQPSGCWELGCNQQSGSQV